MLPSTSRTATPSLAFERYTVIVHISCRALSTVRHLRRPDAGLQIRLERTEQPLDARFSAAGDIEAGLLAAAAVAAPTACALGARAVPSVLANDWPNGIRARQQEAIEAARVGHVPVDRAHLEQGNGKGIQPPFLRPLHGGARAGFRAQDRTRFIERRTTSRSIRRLFQERSGEVGRRARTPCRTLRDPRSSRCRPR